MTATSARVFATVACLLLTSVPARAQGWGVRGGASINPDQLAVGSQYEMPLVDQLWFQPGADLGFGNGTTLFAAHLDAVHRWPLGPRPVWTLYAGGGPALNHYRLPGYSESAFGLDALGGARHASGMFAEFRLGFLDSPDYRFSAGYTFSPRRPRARPTPPRR